MPIHYLDYGPRRQNKSLSKDADNATESADKSASPPRDKDSNDDNAVMKLIRHVVCKLLNITLRFRFLTLFFVFCLFVAAITIFGLSASGQIPLIKIKFFPDDYTLYYVNLEGPGETPIEEIDRRLRDISRFIMADGPGMAAATTGVAGMQMDENYQNVYANNIGMVLVTMPLKKIQTFADPVTHLDAMRERIKAEFAEDNFSLSVIAQKDGPPTGKDINVRILGADVKKLRAAAAEIEQFMRDSPDIAPHLVDFENDLGQPNRVLQFSVDQARAREYDLTTAQVAMLAGSVLDGRYIGKFRASDEEVDLKLRIDSAYMAEPADALMLPLIEDARGPVRLGDVGDLAVYSEPAYIKRYQNERAITLKANIKEAAPTSTPAIIKRVDAFYADIRQRYPGVSVTFGGEHEDTQRSYTSLAYAFGLAVLIMYLILATQFRSYLQPLIILSAVIFALIGVIFGSFITQTTFTVNSFVAVVGLTGVVVNNSLVLIDFINKRYRAGMERRQAIDEGIRIRLRPIVLTTLTTTLGLLPMALGIPYYSTVWSTMASTFVTGLAASALLTLLVVPVLWDLLTRRCR